jgi:hypothetical protein
VIDDVRLTFAALREGATAPAADLKARGLDGHEGAYLALDDEQRPHLLLATSEETLPVCALATLELQFRTLELGGASLRFLDVACLLQSLAEVFDHFVVAVVERLDVPGALPVPAVTDVLQRWRQFLVAGPAPPGRDKLAAVFGELLVLLDIVLAGGGAGAWVGPFGSRHDFRRDVFALEVKTTRSHTAREVTVHGEDQLLPPASGALLLHFVRLEEVLDGGRSVATLVDELLATGASAEQLYAALSASGVAPAELAAVSRVSFDTRERLTIPIDESTPRIIPDSFIHGARPVGVLDLTYRIDLDHSLDRALDPAEYTAAVRRLATGALG